MRQTHCSGARCMGWCGSSSNGRGDSGGCRNRGRGRCNGHRSRGHRCDSGSGRSFQNRQQVANVDGVTHFDFEFFEHAGVGRWDFHRGFVGLDGDQGLLDLDGVTGFDKDFDHRHIFEIADVGDMNFNRARNRGFIAKGA